MYAKNVKFPSGFLCSSFVEGETKEAFCFSNVFFLHMLYLENEEKTSENKICIGTLSDQFEAHIPKIRQIWAKIKTAQNLTYICTCTHCRLDMPPALHSIVFQLFQGTCTVSTL